MTAIKLRGYQEEAVTHVRDRFAAGDRRLPIVMATGLGKSVVFSTPKLLDDYLDAGKRILFIVHTDELCDQAVKHFRRNNPGRRVGIVKAGMNETHAQIIVSSRQTLGHATGGPRRLAAIRNVGLIIIDEAHHATRTNTYGKILEHFGCFESIKEPSDCQCAYGMSDGWGHECGWHPALAAAAPHVAGFTATLARGDKQKLSTVWQSNVKPFSRDILFGIRLGYLLDVAGKRVVVPDLDMSRVRQSAGDYRDADMAEELERTFAPEVIAAAYADHASYGPLGEGAEDFVEYRKGIAFWPLVDTAYHGAKAFNEAGIRSEVIHGELPKPERRAMLARLHSGETRVIHGVGVLTEGFDEPTCDVVVVARPTRSAPLFQQMVGRVLRPDLTLPPDQRGKALILDVVGAGAAHDLRSLIDLSPERPLSAAAELNGEFSLLELDEWVVEQEQESGQGGGFELGAEDYAGQTEVLEFDPLGRSQLWSQTPGGTWFMGAGGDAYAFLVPSLAGEPSHFDVVLASKLPYAKYDRRTGVTTQPWGRATEHTDLPLLEALGWAEEVAIEHGGTGTKTLTGRKSAWRRKPATEYPKALAEAARLMLRVEDGSLAGEVSAQIDAEYARRRIDPMVQRVAGMVGSS